MNGSKHLIIKLSSRSEGFARGFLFTQRLEGTVSTALWSGSLRTKIMKALTIPTVRSEQGSKKSAARRRKGETAHGSA